MQYPLKRLLWQCGFEKSAFTVSYSYSFGFDRLQQNAEFFVGKCLKISKKLHGGYRKHVKGYVKTLKISKLTDDLYFTPVANFNFPYLKIGLCDLFPVLLEFITYVMQSGKINHTVKIQHFEFFVSFKRF